MTLGKISLIALGSAILAVPAVAGAQQYYGQPYDGQNRYAQPGYDQPNYNRYDNRGRGDYGQRRYAYGSYPQFRGIEAHIRSEIQSGLRDDLLAPDDARDLMGQLQRIQYQEAREFRVHGWTLPSDDEERIREQLNELDRTVDETRQEP